MTVIDEIKSRIDIVELVTESVQLRRSGKNYTGFCPFHENSRTPAFVVFSDSGTWRCFGQCNEGGDIFKFLMKKEGWDFPEALRYLAERSGVQLKPATPEEQASAEEHAVLRQLLEDAVTFYRHNLNNTPAGQSALRYLLEQRGLTSQTIESFGLGYAPQSWDATVNYFHGKGYSDADLLAVGLASEREQGGVYDRFRHRVIFPIRDERGRMTGFGARILNPDDVPKFLNSPQTALFDKGHLLYGLDQARKSIRSEDQVVIVEGYLDVIALHQGGFTNAVSPMGTALSEHQLNLLKRYTRRIVLALDPDAAGDKATLRGLQIARQAMDRESDPVFDARGLLGHEARLNADIRVTTLPRGQDPDDVVNRDPAEWERIMQSARPVVIHVMETLAAGLDLNDPKVKNALAAQVMPLIQDVPSAIERETYLQRLARLLRVSEETLTGGRSGSGPVRPSRTARRGAGERGGALALSATPAVVNLTTFNLEMHCLGILMRHPDLLYQVDRQMQEGGLPRLRLDDFQHSDHQAIFRLLQEAIDQDLGEPLNYVLNHLSLPLMELSDELLARTGRIDPLEDKVFEDLMRGLLELRRRTVHQAIEYVGSMFRDAQEEGDLKATQYGQIMVQHSRIRDNLDRAIGKLTNRSVAS